MKKKIVLNIYILVLISLLFTACKKDKTAPEVNPDQDEVVNEGETEQEKLLIGRWELFSKKETSVVDGNIVSSKTYTNEGENFVRFEDNNKVTLSLQGTVETKGYRLLSGNKILIGDKIAILEFPPFPTAKLCVITTRSGDKDTYVEVKLTLVKLF